MGALLNRLLRTELRGFDLVVCYFAVLLASIAWGMGVGILWIGPVFAPPRNVFTNGNFAEILVFAVGLFSFFVTAALWEELIWRFLPLWFSVKMRNSNRLMWVVIIIASVSFGLAHGAFMNIFLQGVLGVFWCLTYIMCGGSSGKILKPLCMTTMIHASYNFCTVLISYILFV